MKWTGDSDWRREYERENERRGGKCSIIGTWRREKMGKKAWRKAVG